MNMKISLLYGIVGSSLAISPIIANAEDTPNFVKSLSENLTFSGLMQAEVSNGSDFANTDRSDVRLDTLQLGIDTKANEWISGHVVFLYEEDLTEPMALDEASVTLGGSEETPAFFTIGQMYIPFGVYDSNMISDPFTLQLAETNQSAIQVGYSTDEFYGSVYAFNCDTQKAGDDQMECFGANIGMNHEDGDTSITLEAGYISNIADTGGLDSDTGVDEYSGGYALSANIGLGDFSLIGEYISALDAVEYTGGSKFEPTAYTVEATYSFTIMEKDSIFALGYQATDELAGILPETRIMGVLGTDLTENVSVALEYFWDEDYNIDDGGTDETAQQVTAQVAISF
jgi:hypothetical protein